MSKKSKSSTKKQFISLVVLTIIVAIVASVYFNYNRIVGNTTTETSIEEAEVMTDAELEVHFIDVDQGDSVFIELPDDTCMLIDAGKENKGETVSNYIHGLGYTEIDYFVVTHGDDDHVGGAEIILDDFFVKNIYRPYQVSVKEVKEDTDGDGENETVTYVNENDDLKNVYNTATVKSHVNVISNDQYYNFITKSYTEKDSQGNYATVSTTYDGLKIEPQNGNDFLIEFFGPLRNSSNQTLKEQGLASKTEGYASVYQSKPSYESLVKNEASPIILLEYVSASYLFTGDGTTYSEKAILNSLSDTEKERFLDVDVYHVGHHGANNSSSPELLKAITPQIAVINVGGNSYGHPTENTLSKLEEYCNTNIFRTDNDGNIVLLANDEEVQVKTNNIVGNLNQTTVELPPDEYWYVYVIGITAAVFISGVVYIMSKGKIKVKPYKRR